MKKKTKIVATLGPASDGRETIEKLVDCGVNMFRLNFSHGSHEEHRARLELVREVAKEKGEHVAVLQDLGGPKIRIGNFETETVTLREGDSFVLTTDECVGTSERVHVNYEKLPQEVKSGGTLLLDDGKVELEVERVDGRDIHTKVVYGGEIRGRRGVNAPGASLSIESLTEKDVKDLDFSPEEEVDFIALSFVRSASDIASLKNKLKEKKHSAHVVAKIETAEAVDDIDEIIEASDAVMVARGDLAIEIPAEEVPFQQKQIITKCRELGKPVIVATQMLESMIQDPVPTRAEVSDIANAILDGTDAVMLSGETAVGSYPVHAVRAMARVARRTERENAKGLVDYHELAENKTSAIASVLIDLARNSHAQAIVTLTEKGGTAHAVARHRPYLPVVALTPDEVTARKLALTFGVEPIVVGHLASLDETLERTPELLIKNDFAENGQTALLTTGTNFGVPGSTDTVTAIRV